MITYIEYHIKIKTSFSFCVLSTANHLQSTCFFLWNFLNGQLMAQTGQTWLCDTLDPVVPNLRHHHGASLSFPESMGCGKGMAIQQDKCRSQKKSKHVQSRAEPVMVRKCLCLCPSHSLPAKFHKSFAICSSMGPKLYSQGDIWLVPSTSMR